jgi:hypothetical protein
MNYLVNTIKSYQNKKVILLIISGLIAKFLGLIREFYMLYKFQFSIEFAHYLSIISIISLLGIVNDASVLNSFLFPKWVSDGKISIPFKRYSFYLSVAFIWAIILLYNYLVFGIGPNGILVFILVPGLILPMFVNSYLTSILLYQENFNGFAFISVLNSILHLLLTIYFSGNSIIGYVGVRWLVLIITSGFSYAYLNKNQTWFNYESKLSFKELMNLTMGFVLVNSVVWFTTLTKMIMAIIDIQYSILVNYAIIISLSLYSIAGKNFNIVNLKDQIKFKINLKRIKIFTIFYGIFFSLFFLLIIILIAHFKSGLGDFTSKVQHLNEIIFLASFYLIAILLLGYLDLSNQVSLGSNFSIIRLFSALKIFIMVLSIAIFSSIILIKFI